VEAEEPVQTDQPMDARKNTQR